MKMWGAFLLFERRDKLVRRSSKHHLDLHADERQKKWNKAGQVEPKTLFCLRFYCSLLWLTRYCVPVLTVELSLCHSKSCLKSGETFWWRLKMKPFGGWGQYLTFRKSQGHQGWVVMQMEGAGTVFVFLLWVWGIPFFSITMLIWC